MIIKAGCALENENCEADETFLLYVTKCYFSLTVFFHADTPYFYYVLFRPTSARAREPRGL